MARNLSHAGQDIYVLLNMARKSSHARQELVKARLLGLGRKFFFFSEKCIFWGVLGRKFFFFSGEVHFLKKLSNISEFLSNIVHFWAIFVHFRENIF